MKKVVVSLSGGMDSTTVLAYVIDCGYDPECVMFNYGSKHNAYEVKAVRNIARHYRVPVMELDITQVGSYLKSNLLTGGGDIPEGHYEEESMKQTVVPGRNLIFCSVLAGFAWSYKCSQIYLGIHAGDHHIYPDCRPEFFEAMNRAVQTGTDFQVSLQAPFLNAKKADILRQGILLKVPYELTRTCYKNQLVACGKCGSCQERLESFQKNGGEDPITYETRRELIPRS